jgi:mycothiol synthase
MTPFALRAPTGDDLPAIHSVLLRAEAADGVNRVMEFEELCEELDDERVPLRTHARVAELHGEIVGFAYALHMPSDVKEERCYLFGGVDPLHRGRGVGRALTSWAIETGRALLASSPRDLPRHLRVQVPETADATHRLMKAMGFAPVRYIDDLVRPLDQLPPADDVDGITIVPWPDDRDEDIRHEKNDAFMDHWGSTPSNAHDWQQQVRGFGARPDLSFIALDADDNVIGHALNHRYEADDRLIGRSEGWIDNLSTLGRWRGHGVATALIIRSLRAFHDAGLTHAALSVDSENPTGATRLYHSLGFQPSARTVVYEIT